jgi:hypothetical protein
MSWVFSRLKIGALLFSVMLSISPVIATAGTCTEVINNLSDHAVGPNSVEFMMVMNTTDMTWAQYTKGTLVSTRRAGGAFLSGGGLTGRGKQYSAIECGDQNLNLDRLGVCQIRLIRTRLTTCRSISILSPKLQPT